MIFGQKKFSKEQLPVAIDEMERTTFFMTAISDECRVRKMHKVGFVEESHGQTFISFLMPGGKYNRCLVYSNKSEGVDSVMWGKHSFIVNPIG